MKIIWLSANKLGYELLKEALKIEDVEIAAVITLSEKAKTVMYDGVKNKKWKELGIKTFEIEQINQEKDLIKSLDPDLIIMCGWRQLIDKAILNVPTQGVIGFHPTLLPYGRGPAPIINTIQKGRKKSGLTMFYLSEGLDDGDIIGQEEYRIKKSDHTPDVYKYLIKNGKKLVKQYLPLVIKGKAPRIPQNHEQAILFDKPSLKNNEIDLENEDLEAIYNKIRSLSKPYRGAYIKKGNKKLVIWKAELQDIEQ
ncbi:MAG: formyltransferase family protein [Candidatus Margulisiibacteriota bacterium]|nr:formyltransferase family protein [Candidatus Margulisiibacteriota bacterium]